jgi:23S rRNA (cytidine1920-2'-O)/16S rRNA (cytidine1409-2'-O)-methyltransferase
MRQRLDHAVLARQLVSSRSQAESYIRLGKVRVNGEIADKPGRFVAENDQIELTSAERYVSRAGFKLASVAEIFGLNLHDAVILDVGSSTGGFTDFALQHGAEKVIAVDVGTDQLHPSLHNNPRIELHEQTDIRSMTSVNGRIQYVFIDVSFISIREVLAHLPMLIDETALVIAMVKPQFEASTSNLKHKGVIKNDRMRRDILKDFELWASQRYQILEKADSEVAGEKGNRERFYKLRLLKRKLVA